LSTASARTALFEGQIDTYPGGGRYPTSRWQPGEIISDTVYIVVSEDAQGPVLLRFNVGLYDHKTRVELPAFGTDGKDLQYVFAGEVPWSRRRGHPAAGATHRYPVRPGDPVGWGRPVTGDRPARDVVTVTLHWQGLANIRDDYIGFVHLIAPDAESVAQDDHSPLNGRYPTRVWSRGSGVGPIPIAWSCPRPCAGVLHPVGCLYHPESGARLQAISWPTGETMAR